MAPLRRPPLLRALLRALLLPLPGEAGPGRAEAGPCRRTWLHRAGTGGRAAPRFVRPATGRGGAGGPAGRGRERAAGHRPLGAVNQPLGAVSRPLGAVSRPRAPEGWAL